MAIVSGLQIKGLSVYASRGFTVRCRIKIIHQPFLYNLLVLPHTKTFGVGFTIFCGSMSIFRMPASDIGISQFITLCLFLGDLPITEVGKTVSERPCHEAFVEF